MKHLSRRRFLQQVLAAGAGTAILPDALIAGEGNISSVPKNSPLLLVPPCLVKPTDTGITVNIVGGKNPLDSFIKFRETGADTWQTTEIFSIEKHTPINIQLHPLKASTAHVYQVHVSLKGSESFTLETEGSFRTQRTDSSSFLFAMISDSHITPNEPECIKILSDISKSILTRKPDFLLMLGDNIQTFTSHGGPMTEERYGPILYYMLRYGMGDLPASVPVFNVIGNWEGENGWHDEKYRAWARKARMAWIPAPLPDTYPEGGGEYSDYYGFTWGNTLNIVLTVTGYTTIGHVHNTKVGRGDDWTLGEKQKEWLYKQLKKSKAKYKFIYIHHTVAGKAGDDLNTRYGRGGGQAAKIGEQKLIHKWMKKFNVNALFYGHDHVFTDIPVDGIHYTCAGSAGAPWKFTEDETGYKNYIPDSGYTWVEIKEDSIEVSFIKPDIHKPEGQVLHRFEII
ncbi:MAG: metallophosphoesterase [Desulfobacteraceae bacterium]|jgi:predicted phosphodiesterase